MSLHPVAGHEELRERLDEAARAGSLPQSLLLYGPEGVGKQRLGLWLAEVILCREGTGCGGCRGCRLVRKLEHPDLHWFFPLPRPKGVPSDRLREALEEARMEALAERRHDPLVPTGDVGPTGIYLAAVEEMRARAARRPAMGPGAVFLVGDAEKMVSQAASPEAANAFLKVLEEPPPDTFVILTSSRPSSLLPTIRSRTLAVRVPPLDPAAVGDFLRERLDDPEEEVERAARLSQGSIGRALRLLSEAGQEQRERAAELIRSARRGVPAAVFGEAVRLSATGARGEFSDLLETVGEQIRDLLALSLGHPELAFDSETARTLADGAPPPPHALARAARSLDEARDAAAANVNPQAVAAVLLPDLASLLSKGGDTGSGREG